MKVEATLEKDLEHRFKILDNKRKSILRNSEDYAKWTLPYVFPPVESDSSNVEMQLSKDSIGAKAVNNLANKIAMTLFPGQRLFFRLRMDSEGRKAIAQAENIAQQSGQDAHEQLKQAMNLVEKQLLEIEQDVLEKMDMISFTPIAVEAAKHLIVTGNALLVFHDNRETQYFSLKDYVVVRDVSGAVIEIITRECKAYETFNPEVQKQLKNAKPVGQAANKSYTDDTPVTVYTQIRLADTGKFKARQQADHVDITKGQDISWPKDTVPYIPLTWNLVRGEDYGRGLVADYAGAFHAIEVLTESLLNMATVLGDIKFLVDPASRADVSELNNSPPGSYHQGKEGDISIVTLRDVSAAQFISTMIDRYENQISEAFLLNSNRIRDAERVTAEEIRMVANELEISNGGIYSRLASTWQKPMASILLDSIGFSATFGGVQPQVVTGMDSLSRAGEIDNIKLFLADLAILNGVPEDVRARIDIPEFAAVIGTNRQVDYKKFIKSEARIQAEQQQAMQAQMQMQAAETQGQVAAAAGKAAVEDTE